MGVRCGICVCGMCGNMCVFVLEKTPIITVLNVLGGKHLVKVNSNLLYRYLYPDGPYLLGESTLRA